MKMSRLLLLWVLLFCFSSTGIFSYDLIQKNHFTPKPYFPNYNAGIRANLHWVTNDTIVIIHYNELLFMRVETGEIFYNTAIEIQKYERIHMVDKELGIIVISNSEPDSTETFRFIEVPTGHELESENLEAFHAKKRYHFEGDDDVLTVSRIDTRTFTPIPLYTMNIGLDSEYSMYSYLYDDEVADYIPANGQMLLTNRYSQPSSLRKLIFLDEKIQEFKRTVEVFLSDPRFLNDYTILTAKYNTSYEPKYMDEPERYYPVILDSDFNVLYKNEDIAIPEGFRNFDVSPDRTHMVVFTADEEAEGFWGVRIYKVVTSIAVEEKEASSTVNSTHPISKRISLIKEEVRIVNDNNVNVRAGYSLNSKKLYQVHKKDRIIQTARTKEKHSIGKMNDYWYKVKVLTKDGELYKEEDMRYEYVWIYGAFLEEEEDNATELNEAPSSNEDTNDSLSIDNNTISKNMLLLISSGIALLLVGLGVIIIVRRKQNKTTVQARESLTTHQ